METNPELEFEFFLAQKLGMSLTMLRESISNEEFLQWNVYFARIAQREELAELKAKAEG